MDGHFLSFCCSLVLQGVDIPCVVSGHLGCFPFLAVVNSAAVHDCVIVWTCVFISLGVDGYRRRGVAGGHLRFFS